ncbi:TatD family hydrolase [Luteolibacter yonseiensis]|uniref:TatD family hydrolase n=1 Tax=Luteolibacter yonseiensis TaxID=1144680 RepID=A0A934R2M0_9BACT|nr:TatD family hydrolase [Luteolibacter yonseiensis]MBK1814129.1 TatD family hydrolase [Luteolibacter yonseiensis]
MPLWTDAHNHLQDPRLGDAAPVVAAMKAAGVARCIVNATREADWDAVETLSLAHPDFVAPAFGIHPWHAHTATPGWQDRLAGLLEKHPQASIGECGLDQWVSTPPLEIQRPVFIDQLRLGREMDRAVTIHCLKAWGELFEIFKEDPPPPRFLMHSFGGSIEIARRLIPLGAYFSFSGYFLQPRKSAVIEVFRQLPQDRILLETDAPDMLPPPEIISHPLPENHNHPANLAAIGEALAGSLGMSGEALAELTRGNAERCFFP